MTILGVSNSFTGGSQSLELLENHIYGYSGMSVVNNVETDLINTTTGNYYAVGEINFSMATITTLDYTFKVYLNGVQTMELTIDAANGRDGFFNSVKLIVPAYTELRITGTNSSSSSDLTCAANYTGRVYR